MLSSRRFLGSYFFHRILLYFDPAEASLEPFDAGVEWSEGVGSADSAMTMSAGDALHGKESLLAVQDLEEPQWSNASCALLLSKYEYRLLVELK